MKIMVSACLLGENCKYNGKNNYNEKLVEFCRNHEVIPVCPEVLGGLPTPRLPAEIVNGEVRNRNGSVDKEFRSGARAALEKALSEKPDLVILQSRSPSCGVGIIYDGTFCGGRIPGNGVFAQLLIDSGINTEDVAEFLKKNCER